ncbi:mesenchyme-specific cell surface glycoprotein-like [Pecten maximus]|uniref:mesenchyme-specific cell surface glycoprotein-like n=1 Tax=Pecten maximus TaxID=6579 RepID=UPI001457EFF9|nr:mesenchyme-specific cell surface glycoprotein-like [Pecten maximus]
MGNLVDIEICGDTIAVLVEGPLPLGEGHVYLCDRYQSVSDSFDCTKQNRIIVGESPKSFKYTSDCEKLIVANEGRAGLLNGVFTDPVGTVSIIDKRLATAGAPCTRELSFNYFDSRTIDFLTKGLRWTYRGDHNNGIVTTFSQDLEPEGIAISDDNTRAYVTLPEANGIAEINLVNDSWLDMYAMGVKDWSTQMLDASDSDAGINMVANYAVKGMYQPTAAVYVQGMTSHYVVTANTGAMRTYTMAEQGVDYSDNGRGHTLLFDSIIDAQEIPANLIPDLNSNARLGRAHMSVVDGRSIISGLISDIHLFGGRDLGFWNTLSQSFTYTTGDQLETRAKDDFPAVFNGDCSDTASSPSDESDTRSDDLGPEPNVLAAGHYNSVPIIAAATRNGLIYLYTLSVNTPTFNSVYRLGNVTAEWGQAQGSAAAGDGIISDMGIIRQNIINSDPHPYVYVISRGTGSVSINRIVQT